MFLHTFLLTGKYIVLKLKNCLVLIEILGKDLRVNYEGKDVILQMKISSNIIGEAIPHQLSHYMLLE